MPELEGDLCKDINEKFKDTYGPKNTHAIKISDFVGSDYVVPTKKYEFTIQCPLCSQTVTVYLKMRTDKNGQETKTKQDFNFFRHYDTASCRSKVLQQAARKTKK